MFTEKSFFNKALCQRAIKKLSYFKENLETLDPSKVENAITQLSIAKDKGGRYLNSILSYPHFSHDQIEEILELI